MSFTKWFFDLNYLLRRVPWDTGVTPPEVTELIESGALPAGRALDLGCGTGTNSIYLARHGWETVGVDFSRLAIRRAKRKARRERVDCQFFQADVTKLEFLNGPFDLALDIGCLHSVPDNRWTQYAQGLTRLVRPGGLYMLYAWTRPPGALATHGIAPEEVRELFHRSFAVERQEGGDDPTGPGSAWYWMRRRE